MAKMKKKPKHSTAWLKNKKLWPLFSKYIRLRDAIRTTNTKDWLRCCTCDKPYKAFGVGCAQAGHYIPGRRNSLLFEERNAHGQCYTCNVTLKGRPIEYRKFMEREYGWDIITELEAKMYITIQFKRTDIEDMIEEYKHKVKLLEETTLKGG